MNFILFIKQAISSIWANKLRSFLSTLGIVIGISSFVIMIAIGEGAKQSMLKSMGDAGNLIKVIRMGNSDSSYDIFTEEISKEIYFKVPSVIKVINSYNSPNGEIFYNGRNIYSSIKPVGLGDLEYKKLSIKYGNFFNKGDYDKAEKFIILGNGLIKENEWGDNGPFVGTIPIGEKVSISGENFIISGILEEKGWDFDNSLFIPSSVYKKLFNNAKIYSFEVYADSEENVEKLKENLNYFLYKKSGLKKGDKSSFQVRTNKEALKQFNEMAQKFTLLLGGIGAISLIVGGIGIMNIMVVSVTERTREIGIRKAIGATNKNIMFQFLVESIILTLLGSFIAVLLSNWIVSLIGKHIPDFTPVINSYVLFIAIIVSVSMGIIFGLMPAYKAAKLKPVDALYFE